MISLSGNGITFGPVFIDEELEKAVNVEETEKYIRVNGGLRLFHNNILTYLQNFIRKT